MLDEQQLSTVDWSPGARLPQVAFPPLTRTTLALYAGGSGDHNPLHIDIDFARSVAGMNDVIGQGMLTMALAARYVTALASPRSLRAYSLRFSGMSKVGDELACSGRVIEIFDEDDSRCAKIEVEVTRRGGEVLANGSAVLALDAR
jgi:acyl dehydratase